MSSPTRRSLLTASALTATVVALSGCNLLAGEDPSPETQQVMDSLEETLRTLPGVTSVTVTYENNVRSTPAVEAAVELRPDLPRDELVAFGEAAHTAVLDHMVSPRGTGLSARSTQGGSEFHLTVDGTTVRSHLPAAVDGMLSEIAGGADSAHTRETNDGDAGPQIGSYWTEIDAVGLVAGLPAEALSVHRSIDDPELPGHRFLRVVVTTRQAAPTVPLAQGLRDLEPALQSSTTTLQEGHLRWLVDLKGDDPADPTLVAVLTAFLRTLHAAAYPGSTDIEVRDPYQVHFDVSGPVTVQRWSDDAAREAAEPVITKVLAAVNGPG